MDEFQFGGVDSRSNPTNYPPNRLLRCKNFTPLASGQLRLRYGYEIQSTSYHSGGGPSQLTGDPIHSIAYYEQFNGTQFLLIGQGVSLFSVSLADGNVTALPPLITSPAPWGHFRAGNRIFLGNGTDMVNFDGTTLRRTGIRSLTTAEAAAVTTSLAASPVGTWPATAIPSGPGITPGYQLYAVLYNPITGHVGNRMPIGGRLAPATSVDSVAIAGLPVGLDSAEWVVGLGRTNDGGQVPYWLIDGSGNRIVVTGGVTTANLPLSTIDTTQELPTRNGVPLALNRFTLVNDKVFGARDGDNFLYYSEDNQLATNGNFVGVTYESWAGNDATAYPTGEKPRALHTYRFEGWFFSRNALSVWSDFLYLQGTNPWRGPWPGAGCAGQRAFVETPYGPYWLTPDKQLMGYNGSAPLPISEEYEASLLHKIGDQYVATTELAFLRDPEDQIDRLYILSADKNGAPLIIVHDFKIRDYSVYSQGSILGQAYEYLYSGMVPNTFVGAGYTPRQNALDTNGREELVTGDVTGRVVALESGNDDNGNTYTGDGITKINAGNQNTLVSGFEWQGDSNVRVSYSVLSKLALADFTQVPDQVIGDPDNPDNRYGVDIGEEARWIDVRMQLDSHPADGNFDLTDPPFTPLPIYGLINYVTAKMGTDRPLGQ